LTTISNNNSHYIKRTERLNKVSDLLEQGATLEAISQQLSTNLNLIKKDVKLLADVSEGSLSPEICAEKRVLIDSKLLDFIQKTMETYDSLIKQEKYNVAAQYLRIVLDTHKFIAKLWGVENGTPNIIMPNVSFNRYDFNNVSNSDINKVQSLISRKNENLSQYDSGYDSYNT